MAKLVSTLNTQLIRTDFMCKRDENNESTVTNLKVNLFFLVEDKDKTYDDAPIYITRYTNSSWLDEYLYNPFMPKRVAKCLSSFVIHKQNTDEWSNLSSLLDQQGVAIIQMGIDGLDDDTDALFKPKYNDIVLWIDFKLSVRKLKRSIEQWYKKKGIRAKLNMVSYISTIQVNENGSLTNTRSVNV